MNEASALLILLFVQPSLLLAALCDSAAHYYESAMRSDESTAHYYESTALSQERDSLFQWRIALNDCCR